MPSFSSFNIANEQRCQQTRFVVTWQEGLYFGQEKQSLMYFFLLLYVDLFPIIAKCMKITSKASKSDFTRFRAKISLRTDKKLVFARKLKMILFGLFSKLCVIEFTPDKTSFWSAYHLSSDVKQHFVWMFF